VKLLVGLGNPGPRYTDTRHNVGYRVVERAAGRAGIDLGQRRFGGRFGRGRLAGLDVGVLEPETFMNRSGVAVAEALRLLPVGDPAEDVLVVLDDLDLPFGRLRLRLRGGAGGHRGLEDVIRTLGSEDVPRLRFGIGRPTPPLDPVAYVLQAFAPEERERLDGALEAAADAAVAALRDGVAAAMNQVNRAPAEPEPR
jgi:PTH1 family peptidyl-tRNA hydrolase